MKTFGVLFLAAGLFGQSRGYFNPQQPFMTGGFGNVVFPGGTPATTPGVTRNFGNVAFPGGGGPKLVVPDANNLGGRPFPIGGRPFPVGGRPFSNGYGRRNNNNTVAIPYAYPVFVGGGYDAPYMNPYSGAEQAPAQPNVTVVYPPQQANPVIIAVGPSDQSSEPVHIYQSPSRPQAAEEPSAVEPAHYLIAFKDHTIYAAVAYWVQGDTLHYFTSGNTHNQVSISLVDRDLTERLNRESGVDMKLPAAR
jgi:hypothetical protein